MIVDNDEDYDQDYDEDYDQDNEKRLRTTIEDYD